MAIFSKKQNSKKPEDQPKVIVEGAEEQKPQESAPNKEVAAADAPAAEAAASPQAAPAPPATDAPAKTEAAPDEVEPEPIETPPAVAVQHRFGIDDAIQLMRTLPVETNAALVVRVVRATLSAVHVSIEEIIEDALRKETRVKESIAKLETQIVELDKQLGILRREISAQQADLKETANVRERLHQTDQYPMGKLPPPPPMATVPRPSQTKPVVS